MKTKTKDEFLQLSSEESQSEEDEDAEKLTEEVEKDFYKTLSLIKSKDPSIYKKDVNFFKDNSILEKKNKNSKKSTPLTLKDYERKLVVEKGGELSDEEPLDKVDQEPTYVEEQELLKNSLKAFVHSDSEDNEESEVWGGLFKKREKTKKEKEKDEKTYKEWLKGQKDETPNEEEKEMKPLKEFWTDPELNEGDKFLRDYILEKRFLENDDTDAKEVKLLTLSDESDNEADEEDSEQKINHRFEEADQEFIKRYPRNMENSLRRKDDHRKKKREEVKERKIKEKEKKRAEIKKKQKLKKKEIEDKLEELKRLTGNDQLAFDNVLNEDFDLDEHDKAMQRLFSEDFYSQEDPNFNPEGGAEFEDNYNDDYYGEEGDQYEEGEEEQYEEGYGDTVVGDDDNINCEDPNFNMDCDYNPAVEKNKKDSRSRRRKDKHRRTTLSQAVSKEKPTFDPEVHKSFQEYVDQYYGMDCEDFIGDLPCRFKYRQTVPNSYGLTIEEILAADEKELERWCSIKRIHQLRPENKEKGDVKVYKKKAQDEILKRKILPSLYKTVDDEKPVTKNKSKKEKSDDKSSATIIKISEENEDHISNTVEKVDRTNKVKNKKKKKQKLKEDSELIKKHPEVGLKRKLEVSNDASEAKRKKKNKNQNKERNNYSQNNNKNVKVKTLKPTVGSNLTEMSDARLLAYGIKPKKFRNKLKYKKEDS